MRRIFRKNQMVLTVLAVLVAVAGYITLTENSPYDDSDNVSVMQETNELDEKVAAENSTAKIPDNSDDADLAEGDLQSLDEVETTADYLPGEAVLTSGMTVSDFMADARLSREQVRASNKETLLSIIDSEQLGDDQKQEAINSMLELTETAEKENATETLLSAKGFDNSLVTIIDGRVNVVIAMNSITDAQKAQIEDIVKQKTEMSSDQIVISLMEIAEDGM